MSYCRFSAESDVYVFGTFEGTYECCACSLSKHWEHETASDMIAHLEAHMAAGHQVPQYAIDRLQEDRLREEANDGT